MAEDIKLNNKAVNDMSSKILEATTPIESSTFQQNYTEIIKEAKNFNKKYQITLKKMLAFEEQLKIVIQDWHKTKAFYQSSGENYKNSNEYIDYLKTRRILREQYFNKQIQEQILNTYKLALQFQKDINKVLGQKVITAYVWVNSKGIPETYLIEDMSDFLKLDLDRYGNITSRYRQNVKLLRQHAKKVEADIKDSDHFKFKELQTSYNEIFKRYNSHKVKKGSGAYVLWLNPKGGQKWHGALVSSFGSINEAYANILLHEDFNPTEVSEDHIEQFMNIVLNVTNLSGTLEGDITIKDIEYAVKSNQASTLSIQQLYEISEDIINNKLDNYDKIYKYLIDKKHKNKQKEQKINVNLESYLKDYIGGDMNDIINQFKK